MTGETGVDSFFGDAGRSESRAKIEFSDEIADCFSNFGRDSLDEEGAEEVEEEEVENEEMEEEEEEEELEIEGVVEEEGVKEEGVAEGVKEEGVAEGVKEEGVAKEMGEEEVLFQFELLEKDLGDVNTDFVSDVVVSVGVGRDEFCSSKW